MAQPKRRAPSAAGKLNALLAQTIEAIAERKPGGSEQAFSLTPVNPVRIIAAYSGGKDSTALVEMLVRLKKTDYKHLIESVTAVHVHHGLNPKADEWVSHATEQCARWGIRLRVERVYVPPHAACGPEAAARQARYKALMKVAQEMNADAIFTAHHLDDHIETFLIQWIRGAGPEGLTALSPVRMLENAGADTSLVLARPWLTVSSAEILTFVKRAKLKWVEDDSNADTRFLRNLIRNEILPPLDAARPGWRTAAARSINLVAQSAAILGDLGEDDCRRCAGGKTETGEGLNIAKLLALGFERQANCLRTWLATNGVRSPSHARLTEILRQLRQTHADTKMSFRIGGKELRRWGVDLVLVDPVSAPRGADLLIALKWTGAVAVSIPAWGGVLRFESCRGDEPGFDANLLKEGKLELRSRKGGEKIKLYRLRPSRNLKHLFQAAGVPAFERGKLPLVWLNDRLIYAAGLGAEVRSLADPILTPNRVRLVWVPDKPLLTLAMPETEAQADTKKA